MRAARKRLVHVLSAALCLTLVVGLGPAVAAFSGFAFNSANKFQTASTYLYSEEVLADSPFLYYRMSELSGTAVADSSGNSRGGTMQGSWAYGTSGALTNSTNTALTSAGSNNAQIYTAVTQSNPKSLSLELWFRTSTTAGGRLLGFGVNASAQNSTQDRQLYMAPNGTLVFGIYNTASASVKYAQTAGTYNDNQWHHVVAVLDPNNSTEGLRIYVDGVKRAHAAYADPENYTGYWRVGWDAVPANWPGTPGSTTFNGAMDEVAVYSSSLSETRVQAHHAIATLIKTYRQRVASDKPWLWYRFGEATGTAAADNSGAAGRGGTYQGGFTLGQTGGPTGESDKAVLLDGSSGYVSSSGQQSNPTTFSIEAWFKTTTPRGRIVGFGSSQTGASTQFDRHIYMTTAGKLTFGVYTTSTQVATSRGRYDDGRWHHVAATLSGSGMRLYADGVLVATNGTNTAQNTTGYWRVGWDTLDKWPDAGTNSYFSGAIDEVAVYDKELSAAQVRVHADEGYVDRYEREVMADSPGAYWRFGESDTARDRASSYDGTYANGATTAAEALVERNGDRAARCDGTDDAIRVGDNLDRTGTSAFSLEAWVRPTSTDIQSRRVVSKETNASGTRDGYLLWVRETEIGFERHAGSASSSATSTTKLTLDVWHHIVATYDGANMRLYVNGDLKVTSSSTVSLTDNTASFSICEGVAAGDRFAGYVDEVASYGHALSATRVTEHFRAGLGLP